MNESTSGVDLILEMAKETLGRVKWLKGVEGPLYDWRKIDPEALKDWATGATQEHLDRALVQGAPYTSLETGVRLAAAVVVFDPGGDEIEIVLSEAMHAMPAGARALRLAQLSAMFVAKAESLAGLDDGAVAH